MTYLIRASSHSNNISVMNDVVDGCVTKTSADAQGIARLKTERAGIAWYADRLKKSDDTLIGYTYTSEQYARLDIKKFSGHKVSYTDTFSQNYEALERCVSHYIDVWPKGDNAPVHGDLTLDNVVFNNGSARFFDWEHFTEEDHPWGFDILYCLLSALLLPLQEDQFPAKKDCDAFVTLLFKLFDHGLSSDLAEYPLQNYRRIFREKSCWKDIISNSPHKLFPMKYEELYADIVDDQITRRIRHKRYDIFKQKTLDEKKG